MIFYQINIKFIYRSNKTGYPRQHTISYPSSTN